MQVMTEPRPVQQPLDEGFKVVAASMFECCGYYTAARDANGRIVDFRIEYVNDAVCSTNGISREQQEGRLLCEVFPATRRAGRFEEFCRVVETGAPLVKEISIRRVSSGGGETLRRTFNMNAARFHDGFIACWRDVTPMLESERELREEMGRASAVLNSSADGLLVIDAEGVVKFANPAAITLLKGKTRQLIGFHFGVPAIEASVELVIPSEGQSLIVELRASEILWEGKAGTLASLRDVTIQRQAEQELRASESKLREAERLGRIGNWELDLASQRITWSEQTFRMYEREPALGDPTIEEVEAHYSPEQAEMRREHMRLALEDGKSSEFEVVANLPSGKVGDFALRVQPVYDARGQVVRLFGTVQDITERKQALRALEVRENQLSLIYGTVDDVIYQLAVEKDGRFRFISINPAFSRVTGLRPEQVTGFTVDEIIPQPSLALALEKYREAIRSKSTVRWEETTDYPTGARTGRVSIAPVFDATGTCTHLVGAVHDVTERRKADLELARREAQFSSIVENSVDLIAMVDSNGIILLQSPSVLGTLGYTPEELVGRNIFELIHPEDTSHTQDALMRGFADLSIHHTIQVRMRHKEGSWIQLESAGRALPANDGTRISVITSRDVTERKVLQDQLRQSQKMEAVGSLAGGIAHDFNNLLSIILSYATFIQDHLKKGDRDWDDVQQILTAGDRAAGLTRQLLTFSRRQVVKLELLDLNVVVRNFDKMLRRVIGEDIELQTRPGDDLHSVRADSGQMEQIVMNLAINARDAMPTGGHLSIETANITLDEEYTRQHLDTAPGDYVMVAVSDNGVGMDEATCARIFEPFFTTKEQGKGTGLGLATVHGIVKQAAGSIWVYSEPGQGTTFKIFLPAVTAQIGQVATKLTDINAIRGHETVLVVEDEAIVRAAACRMLREQGYKVLEAGNGEEALSLYWEGNEAIDLLLTDVVMPKMSGRQLVERLHIEAPTLRSLYMSGYTDDAIVHHGVQGSEVKLVQKPFSKRTLLDAVRSALDAPVQV